MSDEEMMKNIMEKLGFDPLHPPRRKKPEHDYMCDDATPSPYSKLTKEESIFLYPFIVGHPAPNT